jgi:large subunit ribosomal protein L28
MSWKCELSGKSRQIGNKVSHSNIKTKKVSVANLTKRKWFIEELDRSVTLTLSSKALRTIHHRGGLAKAILAEHDYNLSDRLLKLKRDLEKKNQTVGAKKKVQIEKPETAA